MSDFDPFDAAQSDAPVEDTGAIQQDAGSPVNESVEDDPFASAAAESNFSAPEATPMPQLGGEVKDEETPLSIWERERAVVLQERASKAARDKEEQLRIAKEELAKFYADAEARLQKNAKTNRADEKGYKADMKTTFESGTQWEKVNKLVNLQPKASEKAGTSRVDRMRKLLIQLKASK